MAVSKDRLIAGCVAAVALGLRVAGAALPSYLVLGTYALTGRSAAIRALAISWFVTMMTPGIAADAGAGGGAGRYFVVLLAAVSVAARSRIFRTRAKPGSAIVLTFLLGGVFIGHSLLFSVVPEVSLLKATVWTFVAGTVVSAWGSLTALEHRRLEVEVFGGLTALLVASLPLAATSLGYRTNGTGFQGLLNHPQAFGVTAAVIGAWVTGRSVETGRPSVKSLALAAVIVGSVVLSESRTGGLALVAGLVLGIASVGVGSRLPLRNAAPGLFSRRALVGVVAAGVTLALSWELSTERVTTFIEKRGAASSPLEAYEMSRGRLIDAMRENIAQRPLTGIGLGVASDPGSMTVERDPVLGLPTGAPVEKGVMPLAILEEVGMIAAGAVLAWLFALTRGAARHGIAASVVFWTALATNLGESTLFSAGGVGLLTLIAIGWASTDASSKTLA